jgi:glycogen operon protein
LAFTLAGVTAEEPPLHIMLNMGKEALEFAVPHIDGWSWRLAIDTDREPSIIDRSDPSLSTGSRVRVAQRSLMVLEGRAA